MFDLRYGLYYIHRHYDPTQPGIFFTHIKLYVLTGHSLLIEHRRRTLGFVHEQKLFSCELKVPIVIWLKKAITIPEDYIRPGYVILPGGSAYPNRPLEGRKISKSRVVSLRKIIIPHTKLPPPCDLS